MKLRTLAGAGLLVLLAAPVAGQQDPPAAEARATGSDAALYEAAAERAWRYADALYVPETGLFRAHADFEYVTLWDVASGLMALHAARRLGLLPDADYHERMRRGISTLQTLPFYDGAAFGRVYSARTGQMVLEEDLSPTARGDGWSALDIGRLLSALKVVASNEPRYESAIDSVVQRLDMRRLVRDGYLWGERVTANGRVERYPEGRIGYEQYAAAGFAVWGHRAERALDLRRNSRPVAVEGVRLLRDRRGDDRLTSEPFYLMAMELDLWGEPMAELARGVLAAQEARWRRTGQVTLVSEDAHPDPPHHFYYYTVYHDGQPFAIDAQGPLHGATVRPWVSTKAAFAWHALLPGEYTAAALAHVADAHAGAGFWHTGVIEGTGALTGTGALNTAGVILTAALYRDQGGRLFVAPGAAAAAP
jgi:hypothetical protein